METPKTTRTWQINGNVLGSLKKVVWVLGSSLFIFAAARNTVTWQLQRFWGASGNFWQNRWDSISGLLGNDDFYIGALGTFAVITGSYYVFNVFFIVLDVTGQPQCLLRYKIQPHTNKNIYLSKVIEVLKVVTWNQFAFGFPFYMGLFYVLRWRGSSFQGELPTFHWVLFELLVFSLSQEVGFYYTHRMMHRPWFYKNIHKMHHEWPSPISVTSMYCKPSEFIICNVAPSCLGAVVMGSHIATYWLWMVIAAMGTTFAHSGYHFPFLMSPEPHDFHHFRNLMRLCEIFTIICNVAPSSLGAVVMGSHIATYWLWMVIAAMGTTFAHSGYHLPFLMSPEPHDFHHFRPSQNFGTLGVLDRLHGTDEIFRASKAYQRHFMSLSLVPLREQFPDDDKAKK